MPSNSLQALAHQIKGTLWWEVPLLSSCSIEETKAQRWIVFTWGSTTGMWENTDSVWGLPDSELILVIIICRPCHSAKLVHACYVIETVLGVGDPVLKKTVKNSCPRVVFTLMRRTGDNSVINRIISHNKKCHEKPKQGGGIKNLCCQAASPKSEHLRWDLNLRNLPCGYWETETGSAKVLGSG